MKPSLSVFVLTAACTSQTLQIEDADPLPDAKPSLDAGPFTSFRVRHPNVTSPAGCSYSVIATPYSPGSSIQLVGDDVLYDEEGAPLLGFDQIWVMPRSGGVGFGLGIFRWDSFYAGWNRNDVWVYRYNLDHVGFLERWPWQASGGPAYLEYVDALPSLTEDDAWAIHHSVLDDTERLVRVSRRTGHAVDQSTVPFLGGYGYRLKATADRVLVSGAFGVTSSTIRPAVYSYDPRNDTWDTMWIGIDQRCMVTDMFPSGPSVVIVEDCARDGEIAGHYIHSSPVFEVDILKHTVIADPDLPEHEHRSLLFDSGLLYWTDLNGEDWTFHRRWLRDRTGQILLVGAVDGAVDRDAAFVVAMDDAANRHEMPETDILSIDLSSCAPY
jgi:hypothetical protein